MLTVRTTGRPGHGAEVLAEAGRRVREARRRRGMSIKELAFMAGINPSFLSYIETGRRAPSMDTVVRLAEALGIALPRFFGGARPGPTAGERCLGAFLRVAAWSTPKEKMLYGEILSSYARLARKKAPERRSRLLKCAVLFLQSLHRARAL